MKKFSYLLLILPLVFVGFYACNDDDDDPAPITYEMVISDRDSGVFYALDTSTGALESLGYISYNGSPLTNIRGLVYDSNTEMIYISENSSGNNKAPDPDDPNGRIFSVNPQTLEATVINDNADDDWYALPGLIMNDGKILGTVYWDDYNDGPDIDYYEGLIWLNTDGTMYDEAPLMYQGSSYDYCCGMSIAYGANSSQIVITDQEDELIICDLNGNVSQILDLNYSNGFEEQDYIKNLAWGNDDVLYAVTKNGDLGHINISNGDFTMIAHLNMMGVSDSDWQALTMIPEFVFEDFGTF